MALVVKRLKNFAWQESREDNIFMTYPRVKIQSSFITFPLYRKSERPALSLRQSSGAASLDVKQKVNYGELTSILTGIALAPH